MSNHLPFKTNGVYVRNILPKSISNYKPILDTNKFWSTTNYEDNISSYEIIWVDYYMGSKIKPPHIKARFDTKTGEILSIVDHYFNNFTLFGIYEVAFDDEKFTFGNDEFTIYCVPDEFDKDNSLDSLYVFIEKTNTDLSLDTKEIYQKEKFRFIPFLK